MNTATRLFSAFNRFTSSTSLRAPIKAPSHPIMSKRSCSFASPIFEVESSEDFNEKVLQSPVPVIVDFHADWCGPCRTLGPRLEEKVSCFQKPDFYYSLCCNDIYMFQVRGRHGEVLMAKVNVDFAGEIATDFQITAVPTVISFRNGERVGSFQGVIDDADIDVFIDDAISQ